MGSLGSIKSIASGNFKKKEGQLDRVATENNMFLYSTSDHILLIA